jgi:hypothetical protein
MYPWNFKFLKALKRNRKALHCKKKVSDFSVPSRDVTNQTLLLLFPARESLVSDIPAGNGNIANFFYSVGPPAKIRDVFKGTFIEQDKVMGVEWRGPRGWGSHEGVTRRSSRSHRTL